MNLRYPWFLETVGVFLAEMDFFDITPKAEQAIDRLRLRL
jgi:hypothetical protein